MMLLISWRVCILKVTMQYPSLNAYHSGISSTHQYVDGASMGNHPTVTRLLQGVFKLYSAKFWWRKTLANSVN